MSNESTNQLLSVTLYAFGNKTSPRSPRADIDIKVVQGLVNTTSPPTGASTFADVNYAPLSGHYYKLDKGTQLPSGIGVIADGVDAGGNHSRTHHTLYPTRPMPFKEFVEKIMNCGWVYVSKKEIR